MLCKDETESLIVAVAHSKKSTTNLRRFLATSSLKKIIFKMYKGSNELAYYVMTLGIAPRAPGEFLDRLTGRLRLREVYSEEECNVIIVFLPVVSRVGTDIEAALKKIQISRPVILVVLHHTFDEDYNAPESRRSVKREGVLTVDILFYEDKGLLRSLRNDEALKTVTDHLITLGALPKTWLDRIYTRRERLCWVIILVILALLICVGIALIVLDLYHII